MIDDVLFTIMRIQCLWIQLSREDPVEIPELKTSLDLCLSLLETEILLKHKKHKKPRERC